MADRARRFLFVFAALTMAAGVSAAETSVPLPEIARGKGEACVAETGFMRRNHPDLLMHQRDQTVRRGVRGKPFSLKECVACHAVAGPGGLPVSAKSPQHFCRSCHDYAAVKIDCFECHASRPDITISLSGGGKQ